MNDQTFKTGVTLEYEGISVQVRIVRKGKAITLVGTTRTDGNLFEEWERTLAFWIADTAEARREEE